MSFLLSYNELELLLQHTAHCQSFCSQKVLGKGERGLTQVQLHFWEWIINPVLLWGSDTSLGEEESHFYTQPKSLFNGRHLHTSILRTVWGSHPLLLCKSLVVKVVTWKEGYLSCRLSSVWGGSTPHLSSWECCNHLAVGCFGLEKPSTLRIEVVPLFRKELKTPESWFRERKGEPDTLA